MGHTLHDNYDILTDSIEKSTNTLKHTHENEIQLLRIFLEFMEPDKMSQLEISFETAEVALQLADLNFGAMFIRNSDRGNKNKPSLFMKVKATGFLINSTILSDVFSRGDCLAVNMNTATVQCLPGVISVTKMAGNMQVRKA